MDSTNRRSSVAKTALALAAAALVLCSCATTDEGGTPEDKGFLGLGESTQSAKNHSWIVDSPHSAALEPDNWLDYAAYYLGEVALAPFRLVGIILDGA